MRITKTEANKVWEVYQDDSLYSGRPLDATVEIYRDTNHSDLIWTATANAYRYEIERLILHATKIYLEPREGYRILDFHTGAKTRLKVILTDK